jgi:3'(2'), 5'-bisphosphate nucleotidase
MDAKKIRSFLGAAIHAAMEAGSIIREIYHAGYTVTYKDDKSPLTAADIAANRIIKEKMSGTELPLISEEEKLMAYESRRNYRYYWLIDPLDGTKEFIKANGEFTVNIAMIRNDKPVMGVVYAPVPDVLYFAEESIGAYRVDRAFQNTGTSSAVEEILLLAERLPLKAVERKFTIVASRSHLNEETQKYIDRIAIDHEEIEIVSRGSSLKLCIVAEGTADIYPRFAPTMEWDTAAGDAILRISGGKVVCSDGLLPLKYNKPDLLNPWFIASR